MNTLHDLEDDGRPMADLSRSCRPRAAYLGLGANLGDRPTTLNKAVEHLALLGVVESISPVYETAPIGFADQPAFLNAVLCLSTHLAPMELMSELLEIEHGLGRVRTFQNAPRSIDLDLLLYEDAVVDHPDLTVPHPRLPERGFVLVPLNDIAPDLLHPQLAVTVRGLLQRLGPITDVHPTDLSLHDMGGDVRGVVWIDAEMGCETGAMMPADGCPDGTCHEHPNQTSPGP